MDPKAQLIECVKEYLNAVTALDDLYYIIENNIRVEYACQVYESVWYEEGAKESHTIVLTRDGKALAEFNIAFSVNKEKVEDDK